MLVTCWDFLKKHPRLCFSCEDAPVTEGVAGRQSCRLPARFHTLVKSVRWSSLFWCRIHLPTGISRLSQSPPPPPHPPTLNVNCKTADTVTRESRLRMFRNFLLKSYYSHSYNAVIGDCWFWFLFRQVYWISAVTVSWEYDIDLSK